MCRGSWGGVGSRWGPMGGVPWAGEEAKEPWCGCCSQAKPTVPGTGGGRRAFPAPGPVQGNKQLWAMMTGPL